MSPLAYLWEEVQCGIVGCSTEFDMFSVSLQVTWTQRLWLKLRTQEVFICHHLHAVFSNKSNLITNRSKKSFECVTNADGDIYRTFNNI